MDLAPVREPTRESSRKRFLTLAGAGAAAAALAACGSSKKKSQQLGPLGQYGTGDVAVLNFLLSLEHLEVAFYAAALDSGKLSAKNSGIFRRFAAEEAQHRAALTAM